MLHIRKKRPVRSLLPPPKYDLSMTFNSLTGRPHLMRSEETDLESPFIIMGKGPHPLGDLGKIGGIIGGIIGRRRPIIPPATPWVWLKIAGWYAHIWAYIGWVRPTYIKRV